MGSEIPQWFWRGKLLHVSKQIWSLNRSLIKGASGCHSCPPKSDAIYQTKWPILLFSLFSFFLDRLWENNIPKTSCSYYKPHGKILKCFWTPVCTDLLSKLNRPLKNTHPFIPLEFPVGAKSGTALVGLVARHTHFTNLHNNSCHMELRDDGED